MTDFSPLDGEVSDRLAGDWVFGSTEALRVNMESPDYCYTRPIVVVAPYGQSI
jgi:hypothetical protein